MICENSILKIQTIDFDRPASKKMTKGKVNDSAENQKNTAFISNFNSYISKSEKGAIS